MIAPMDRPKVEHMLWEIGVQCYGVQFEQWNLDLILGELVEEHGPEAACGHCPIDSVVLAIIRHIETFPLGDSGGMVTA